MTIRQATAADIPAIIALAVEAVSREPWPVKIDKLSMVQTLEAGIPHAASFVWVGLHEGKVQACLAAQGGKSFWHERMQVSVAMFYTRTPGLGIALLREFVRWVKARPSVKMAIFSLEPNADPRIAAMLARMGFANQTQCLTYVRGMKEQS